MRVLLACLLIVSCGKNSSSSPAPATPTNKVSTVDIVDAANLFVTGTDTAGLYLTDDTVLKPGTLYKTTAAGVVQEVTYKNGDGTLVTEVNVPTAISRPADDVVVLDFDNGQYVVNKDSGKAYENASTDVIKDLIADNADLSLVDGLGKMFGVSKGTLVSVDFVGDNLNLTQLSANGDGVDKFWKDKAGNFVYKAEGFKKRTAAGKFSIVDQVICVNTSFDGRVFGYVNNNGIKDIVDLGTGATLIALDPAVLGFTPALCGESAARLGSKVVNMKDTGLALEVFNEATLTFDSITIPGAFKSDVEPRADRAMLRVSAKYVYGIALGKIQRIDLEAKTVTAIEIPNLLEVKSFDVSQDDSIVLNGTLDDGSSFVGGVSAAGVLSVTGKTGAGAITVIKPLN